MFFSINIIDKSKFRLLYKGLWEASRSNGAQDHIGGAIKGNGDRFIILSHDITHVGHLYRALIQEENWIKFFYVEADEVEEASVPENVPVVTLVRAAIKYRDMSCFFNSPEALNCISYGVQ